MTVQHEHSSDLQRNLTNRHLQLIAIGGAIGTGLFMGSGKTISLAGPSILLIYMIIGTMIFFLMRALGELLLSNLNYKSFVDMAYDLLGPGVGFYVGWTYWIGWVLVGMADLTAVVSYLSFWLPAGATFSPVDQAMISAGCVLFLFVLNLMTVKLFGEVEFWFAIIKIVAIIALVLIGIYMVATGFQSPNGTTASLSNIWNHGGIFPHGMSGFLAGFQIAIFAFMGVELVGTTAAETKDPEKNLPKAINSIPVRVILFYVLSLVVVMSVTPWTEVKADRSPFVELFLMAGIPTAAIIMNLVVLSSVMSSMNSGVFSTSRMMFGLAKDGQAPKLMSFLTKNGVPANGLIFSCACIMGGSLLQYFVPNTIEAFTLAGTLCTILFMSVWIIILVCYIRYRKLRPELHAKSKFKMPGGVAMCYAVIVFFLFTIGILSLEDDTRKSLMVSPIWLIVLAIGYYGFYKPKTKAESDKKQF
ncbi:amino acid permease [Acinetobacter rathckeae]|uniref:amino acid permease n=1 Tax=Acinetobacter rathckeae TaxID=2605272 RepID=UPI0018A2DDB2|nr:amino acid permease [Acinetobacter rathckeae]MBF7687415.1 amino acid permease [Acinetobacter rathckeae]MBF7694816.1 amino acid permease [Acinetobacter rathckeae]